MSSNSETGHAKNVANLEDLIAYCTGYGTIYNPSRATSKITSLNTLLTNAQAALLLVNQKLPLYTNAVALREIEFKKLDKLVSRIQNAVRAIDLPKQEVEAVEGICRKIKAKRFKAGPELGKTTNKTASDAPTDETTPEEETTKQISISQRSYDKRVENFTLLVQQVSTFTTYIPNEADLKTTALNTFLSNLKTLNTAVISATTPLSNARIARNKLLYDTETGLVAIATDVKAYVKSLFGAQ
ncbi:MAG: hypothetical protein IT239_04325, partial [Bacteroidia bacterium]|nr:hypothetical protein [Bacteroidia bacterium]